MSTRRPRSTRQARASLEYALSTIAKPNPLVLLWRWRYELAGAVAVAVVAFVATAAIGIGWTIAAAGMLAIAVAATPESRNIAIARAWCVITQHRIRSGCAQAWIHSRTGRLPFIVLTTCEPFGERVRVWCRAGVSAADFEAARHLLAASCWARDVRVTRSDKYAQLVTLDVIRRTPRGLPPATAQATWLEIVGDTSMSDSVSEEGPDMNTDVLAGLSPEALNGDRARRADDAEAWSSR